MRSDADPRDNRQIEVLRLIDELEELVDQGKAHIFGKVFIDEQEFFIQTAKIKDALPADLKKVDALLRDDAVRADAVSNDVVDANGGGDATREGTLHDTEREKGKARTAPPQPSASFDPFHARTDTEDMEEPATGAGQYQSLIESALADNTSRLEQIARIQARNREAQVARRDGTNTVQRLLERTGTTAGTSGTRST
jgi:hypothetical protein